MKYLIAFFVTLPLLCGCKKDSSNPTPNPPNETMPTGCYITKFKNDIGTWTIEYDTKGRIKRVTDGNGYYDVFEYGSTSLTITDFDPEGKKMEQHTATLNPLGYITRLLDEDGNVTKAEYNAEGYLITYEEWDAFSILQMSETYTISNGNPLSMKRKTRFGSAYDSSFFTYTLSPMSNKGGVGESDYSGTMRSFFKPYKNLIKEVKRNGSQIEYQYSYVYETDSLLKEVKRYSTQGLDDRYYNYTCY